MKPIRRREKLARRQMRFEVFMAGHTKNHESGPTIRRRTGGYHRPGSVNK